MWERIKILQGRLFVFQDYQRGIKKIPTACITVEDAEMMWRMEQRGNFIPKSKSKKINYENVTNVL